jgi:hypothetical protein
VVLNRSFGVGWSMVKTLLLFAAMPSLRARGGLAVHAAALTGEDGAHLFVGPSGVGKTTLASRLPAERRLADDVAILVRSGEGGFVVERSPFPGREETRAAGNPTRLAGIHLLEQADHAHRERLSLAEALRGLLPQIAMLRIPWLTEDPLDAPLRLARSAPVDRVGFTRDDPPFWWRERP